MSYEDFDEINLLIDTDPIALGERCRRAERALVEIAETVGNGAPDVVVANTLLGRVKQLAEKASRASTEKP